MSESAPAKLSDHCLHRRGLLKLLPAAVAASAIPNGASTAAPAPIGISDIQSSLLALWNRPDRKSSAFIQPSSIKNVNGMIEGCNAAFLSLWQPPEMPKPEGSFYELSRRFG